MIMLIILQIFSMFMSLMALAQSCSKNAKAFDKIFYGIMSVVFVVIVLFIEGVLK